VPVGPTLAAGVYHARLDGGAFFDHLRVCVAPARADERGQIMGLPGGGLRPFRFRRLGRNVPRPLKALPDQRTTGSCTAELALIASGVLRAGVFVKPSIWDVAAGVLIVREAGGSVLTWRERAWQVFEQFEPMPPGKRSGDRQPALRHWARPLLMGAPDAVERLTARMSWLPRPPKPLQQLLGL
jgi:fructose-1,6-bisphosphatase/inositol monophosphatase family enzyme